MFGSAESGPLSVSASLHLCIEASVHRRLGALHRCISASEYRCSRTEVPVQSGDSLHGGRS